MTPRVCIIGSGVGGGMVAAQLVASQKANIILIDVDYLHASFNTKIQFESFSAGSSFNVPIIRGYGFGGTSNLWHGVMTQFDEQDFQWLDNHMQEAISLEIKKTYEDLEQYFGKFVTKLPQKKKKNKKSKSIYDEIASSTNFVQKDFFVQKKPLNIRQLIRQLIVQFPSYLEVINNAVALHLVGSLDDPSSVKGVMVNVNGKKQLVEADYFILAAGAIESPRILLQSQNESGLSFNNSNVGKYLMDHPWTVIGEIQSEKAFKLFLTDVKSQRGLRYRIGYRLKTAANMNTPGENHCISFKPIFRGEYTAFKEIIKSIIFNRSMVNILKLCSQYKLKDIFSSLCMLGIEKFGLGVYVKRALIFCYLEQPLRETSSVTLSAHKDSYGRHIPIVNWIVCDEERWAINNMNQCVAKSLIHSEYYYTAYDQVSLASGSHQAGTLRMSMKPEDGVIDKNLKIHGLKNVFVCDLSIFPNYGNSNPTFTLTAFALRLAKHLMRTYL